jgi:hypothetical protein
MKDITTLIIRYETEGLSDGDALKLFSKLINNGSAWTLPGSYGRTAKALIDAGFISKKGKINKRVFA